MLAQRLDQWTREWQTRGEIQEAHLLDRIDDPERLAELGETLLDCADGTAWLQAPGDVATEVRDEPASGNSAEPPSR